MDFQFPTLVLLTKVLEGRAYRLQHPWVGIVNRSQADINKNVDMILARRKEQEFFESSPEYAHLASRMGSEYLAKLLSQVRKSPFSVFIYCLGKLAMCSSCNHVSLSQQLEAVIRARIPSITSLISKTIDELESEMNQLGRPIGSDAAVIN
jgi:hypothetical protein